MEDKYEVALSDLLKLAKILNFDIQNLEYKKFDIDRTKIENTVHESIIQAGKENVRNYNCTYMFCAINIVMFIIKIRV